MTRASFAALAIVALTACASAAAAPPQTLADLCQSPSLKGHVVHFHGMVGSVFGTGAVGVVLADADDGNLCDWLLNEPRLLHAFSKQGYRVLVFNYHGTTEFARARDVVAAATELRTRGATSIVLGGASIGAVVAVEAATKLDPAPVAVFGLSASSANDHPAIRAARSLTVPVLFVAAKDDPTLPASKAIYYAATSADNQFLLVAGATHGFFDSDPSGPKVDNAVVAFIAAHV